MKCRAVPESIYQDLMNYLIKNRPMAEVEEAVKILRGCAEIDYSGYEEARVDQPVMLAEAGVSEKEE